MGLNKLKEQLLISFRPDGTQVMTHALRGVGGGIGDLGEVGGGAK